MIANVENIVYLTRFSFLYLCRYKTKVEIDKDELYNIFKKYFIDDYGVYKIFNASDIKNFIAQLSFLKEGELEEDVVIKLKQYNKITERKDSYTHIYDKGGKIKYHLYQDCIAMKEGYIDFRVPNEFHTLVEPKNLQNFLSQYHKTINGYARRLRDYELFENEKTRERLEEYESLIEEKYSPNNEDMKYRQDAVERLRKIFRDSGNELEYIENIYNKELINEYIGLKKITQGYFSREKEEKVNSGIEKSIGQEFDYQAMIKELNLIVQKRKQLCNLTILDNFISKYDYLANKSDSDIKRVIGDWKLKDEDRILLKHYKIPILKDFWNAHRELKTQAIFIINDYIYYKYNFDSKNFTENKLRVYGLECCTFCENKKMSEFF